MTASRNSCITYFKDLVVTFVLTFEENIFIFINIHAVNHISAWDQQGLNDFFLFQVDNH
ncbi:hypothetical protein D3C72_1261770 [compost metagenome]